MRSAIFAAVGAGALILASQVFAAAPMSSQPPTSSTTMPDDSTTAPSTTTPSTTAPSTDTPAATGPGANTSATVPGLTVGEPVKDNTGATIGAISDLKTDASGQQSAVIKMGSDQFQVTSDKLGVANGAATINLTQAQIATMLHGKAGAAAPGGN